MQAVIAELQRVLSSGQAAAYCRLVETRGSTPQKAGATMLVHVNGEQAGTLGGGCVEAEVKRRALAAMERGQSELSVFQLDSDYGWDDGLICGGRMKVLIEPIQSNEPQAIEYFSKLAEVASSARGGTEAVVFESVESPAEQQAVTPMSVLFDASGAPLATLGTAEPAKEMLANLRPLNQRPRPYAVQGVAYLPWLPRCRLVIVGGGHVGQAVAQLASQVDFDVWVIDDRADIVSESRFPAAQRRIAGAIDDVLPDLPMDGDTYCLIVTRGHSHDERALYHLAERGARYVGLIGSRRKIRMIFDDLLEEGIAQDSLEKVYAPLGIHIGSQTVAEIAVSICAELIAHRNLGEVPGRPARVLTAD